MTVVELTGVLDTNEPEFDGPYLESGHEGPKIGDKYLFEALREGFGMRQFDSHRLTFVLAHGGDETLYKGSAWYVEGDRGYSSVTPGSSPELNVYRAEQGSVDLLEKLSGLHGQTVHIRIDDQA